MSSEIIKVEIDLYVVWSHNVDGPMVWGNQAEVTTCLLDWDERKEEIASPDIAKRFERADGPRGTSYYIGGAITPDSLWVFENSGILRFKDMKAFLDSYVEAKQDGETEDGRFDLTILEPFDDEAR